MAIFWGFDLSECSWSSFGLKNMLNPKWHLRKERLIVYQVTMVLCLAAEVTATFTMFKYKFQQNHIENLSMHVASVHNDDFIDAAISTMIFTTLVPTVFGLEYFVLILWPARTYPKWYNTSKKLAAMISTLAMFGVAVASTFVVARRSSFITGVDEATAQSYAAMFSRPPLHYSSWAPNIVYVVLLWISVPLSVLCTILMIKAIKHDEEYGTEPRNSLNESIEEKRSDLPPTPEEPNRDSSSIKNKVLQV